MKKKNLKIINVVIHSNKKSYRDESLNYDLWPTFKIYEKHYLSKNQLQQKKRDPYICIHH